MAQRMVRITLERPWVGRPDGLLPLVIIGTHDVPQRFDDPDANSFADNFIRDIPGVASKGHIPRPVGQTVYVFDASDPDNDSFVVNDFVAIHWFGNWQYPETLPANSNTHYLETKGQELHRVVQIWGGWRYPKQAGPVKVLGELDMRPTSPPPIPHVAIRVLNSNGKPETVGGIEWVYRPWDYFHFDLMCQDVMAPMMQMQAPAIVPAALPDVEGMVAAAVAKALAQRDEAEAKSAAARERMAKARAAKEAKRSVA